MTGIGSAKWKLAWLGVFASTSIGACAYGAELYPLENPVIPSAKLGKFRHGTFPSLKTNKGYVTHTGVDLVAACNVSDIFPFADGIVTDVIASARDPNFRSLGYMVLIEHSAQLIGKTFYTLYLHLSSPPQVTVGQEVVAGHTRLGKVGHTGIAHGCHTHFEIRYFPGRFNPEWGRICGLGDQRKGRHFQQDWEDPAVFFARYPTGLTLQDTSPPRREVRSLIARDQTQHLEYLLSQFRFSEVRVDRAPAPDAGKPGTLAGFRDITPFPSETSKGLQANPN